MIDLRCIIVSVDYWDLLELTLPYNANHFSERWIVTTPTDEKTQQVALSHKCNLVLTNCFYDDGADFNKWKALEWGLDQMGREGWICVMDADVLWPKRIPNLNLKAGQLMTPYRRMCPTQDIRHGIPNESEWSSYPRHRNVGEWAGYSQIFHAEDTHLGNPPWYETDWRHGGGADSFFQRKWPRSAKVRPGWECLHIGPGGMNWFGRTTDYLDGSSPENKQKRNKKRQEAAKQRRKSRSYDHEKL